MQKGFQKKLATSLFLALMIAVPSYAQRIDSATSSELTFGDVGFVSNDDRSE